MFGAFKKKNRFLQPKAVVKKKGAATGYWFIPAFGLLRRIFIRKREETGGVSGVSGGSGVNGR